MEASGPSVPAEFRPLLHPQVMHDAHSSQVVWARVKGYPFWPAQVLNESAAHKKLGKVSHRKVQDVPVMFFGTLEIAWVGTQDIVGFREGVHAGYLSKGKHKNFIKACGQVLEFLVVDKKRKAPQYWWCRAPDNGAGVDADDEELPAAPSAAVRGPGSKAGTPNGKAKAQRTVLKAEVVSEVETGSGSGTEEDSDGESAASSDAESASASEDEEPEAAAPAARPKARDTKKPAAPKGKAAGTSGRGTGMAGDSAGGAIRKPSLQSKASTSNNSSRSDAPHGSSGQDSGLPGKGAAAAQALTNGSGGTTATQPTSSISNKRWAGGEEAAAAPAPGPASVKAEADVELLQVLPPKKKLKGAAAAAAAAQAAQAALPTEQGSGVAETVPLDASVAATAATAPPAREPPPPAPPARAPSAASAMDDDLDIFKLPAEIRRLAGIKLVKKPSTMGQLHVPHPPASADGVAPSSARGRGGPTPGTSRSTAPVREKKEKEEAVTTVPAATAPDTGAAGDDGEKEEGEAGKGASHDDPILDDVEPVFVSRRETRSGATPRVPSSATGGGKGAAPASKAAKDPVAAAPAKDTPVPTPATTPSESAKPASPTSATARRVAAGLRPTTQAPGASEAERERQKRQERESQLQRKRERERERRQALKLAKQAQAQHAPDGDGEDTGEETEDGEEGLIANEALGPEEGVMETQEEGARDASAAEALLGVGEEPGLGGVAVQAAPLDDAAIAAAAALLDAAVKQRGLRPSSPGLPEAQQQGAQFAVPVGRPPRPGSSAGGIRGRESARGSRSAWSSGRARGSRAGQGSNSDAGSVRVTGVPVVAVPAGSRKHAIPPVLPAPTGPAGPAAAVVVNPQPARRSTLLTKRSSDSAATTSDTTATAGGPSSSSVDPAAVNSAPGSVGGAAGGGMDAGMARLISEEELQDAEAAEALQFMQSMGLPGGAPPALALPSGGPDTVILAMGMAGSASDAQTASRGGEPSLPPTQDLAAPLLSQLEAALGMAASYLESHHTQPPGGPGIYAVPRLQGPHECGGFMWPDVDPMVQPGHENFFLPRDWLLARPPKFELLKRSVWVSRPRPKRLHKSEVNLCSCSPPPLGPNGEVGTACGSHCLNRESYVLCDSKLCPAGEACTNKPFQLLRAPRMEPFLTDSRGYGVRTLQPVRAGSFIIEYVGEVIDDKELGRRMEAARLEAQHCYYIMELGPGLYLDARSKGNMSRLLNSSCQPNCETQKWHDASTGEPRVGIFAKHDIAPGEELTYDYFFEQYSKNGAIQSTASFKCMCGAPNCRGSMDNPGVHRQRSKDFGRRIEVHWDGDGMYYRGTVVGYVINTRRHVILYDDGDQEKLNLEEVPYRWITDAPPPGVPPEAAAAFASTAGGTTNAGATTSGVTAGGGPGGSNGRGSGRSIMGGYAAGPDEDEGMLEEAAAVALAKRRSVGDNGYHLLGAAPAVITGAPARKRQRTAAGNSQLPPLRSTSVPDGYYQGPGAGGMPHASSAPASYRSGRGGASAYSGASDADPPTSMFGGEGLESLLQAVDMELGDREAAHQREQQGYMALDPAPVVTAPAGRRGRGSRGAGGVRSPTARRSSAAQQQQPAWHTQAAQDAAPAWGWQGMAQHGTPQLLAPEHTHHHPYHHGQQGQSMDLQLPAKRSAHAQAQHQHALFAGQAALAAAAGMQADGAAGAGGAVEPRVVQLAMLEELLGVRISTFNVPLFYPRPPGSTRAAGQSGSAAGPSGSPTAGGVGLHSHALTTGIATEGGVGAPHLQRTPITTASPGTGPGHVPSPTGRVSANGTGSTTTASAPSTATTAVLPPLGGGGAGPSDVSTRGNDAHARLVASPVLAGLAHMHAGGVLGYESLLKGIDLFKRSTAGPSGSHAAGLPNGVSSNGGYPGVANGPTTMGLLPHALAQAPHAPRPQPVLQ